MHRQNLDERVSLRAGTQSPQSLEHRVIRFLAPEAFHTLSARNAQGKCSCRELAPEFIDQRGLADACFTGDEDDLPLAPRRVLQAVVQLIERWVASHQAASRRNLGRGRARDGAFADRGNEPVTAFGHGLDEKRILRMVPEGTAHLEDVSLDGLRFDNAAGPDRVEQLLVRHQLPGVLHEIHEDGERFGGQQNALFAARIAGAPETLVMGVEPEWSELLHSGIRVTATGRRTKFELRSNHRELERG